MTTACTIFKHKQPETQVHAVTDGHLTLGAVPSENEEGLQVYRLLLCKNYAAYDSSMFTDNEVCRAALVDDDQREVIIVPDKLRRPFATKLSHYALVAAGVVAITTATVSFSKWLPKTTKAVDDLGRKHIDTVYEQRFATHRDEYNKVITDIKKELQNFKVKEQKIVELEKSLHSSLDTGDEQRLYKALSDIRAIDANIADKLEDGVFGGKVDTETLEKLARRVEDIDASFARQLRQAKLVNLPLQDDGLLYFYRLAEQAFDVKYKNSAFNAKLDNLQKVGKISADYFDEHEKLFLHQLHQTTSNLLSASLLRSLEIEKDLLIKLKSKKIKLEHIPSVIKEEMQSINSKYTWSIDNLAGYQQSAGEVVTKITQAAQIEDIGNYNALLERYKIVGDIDAEEIKLISKRDAYRNAMNNVVKYASSSSLEKNVDNRVRQLNIRLANTRKTLFNSVVDAVEEGHYVTREVEMWSRLADVHNKSLRLRQERLHMFKKEIATFERQLIDKQKTIINKQNTINQMSKESAERKKLVLERHDKALKELKAAEEHLRKGRDAEFAALSKEAEKNRRNWLILGAGAGTAGFAVMAAIDRSIWGYGEKQLGKHWSQIFNKEAKFDDATTVKDMGGVLEKLAATFGFKVNVSALSLAN